VDDKSRLAIPASYRQALERADERRLVFVRNITAASITAWPLRDWEVYEDKLLALPSSDPTVQMVLRFQVSASFEVEPDNHGRVVLPAALRAHAGIQPSSEVVISSQINRFEIWNKDSWAEIQTQLAATTNEWGPRLAALGL
jgi:MraZ protein